MEGECRLYMSEEGSVNEMNRGCQQTVKTKFDDNHSDSEDVEDAEPPAKRVCLEEADSVLNNAIHRSGSSVTEEFEIIDDLDDDDGQGNDESDCPYMDIIDPDPSDEDLDDNEIYAWLEEGIDKQAVQRGDGVLNPVERDKIVLKEKGYDPFEVLPEGWVVVTHDSGMPVYLDKQSRVCTLAKPYFLGPGSVRKHDIPIGAIPCLQYRRELEKTKMASAMNSDTVEPVTGNENERNRNTVVSCESEKVFDSIASGSQSADDNNVTERNDDNQNIVQSQESSHVDARNQPEDPAHKLNLDEVDGTDEDNVDADKMDLVGSENDQPSIDQTENMNVQLPSACIDSAEERTKLNSLDMCEEQQDGNPDVQLPSARIESAEERTKLNSLDYMEVRKYCEKLFEFKVITVKKFKTWKDRRKHLNIQKRQSRPALPSSTKLITCPVPQEKGEPKAKKKEFVLNPLGKSYVCILHEYAQHTMRLQPKYTFKELENAQNPYSATVLINDVQYGTGYASSKKAAKMEAAKATLRILIPEMNKMEDDTNHKVEDLSFFDEIRIEDPRVSELCNKAGQPSPYQILLECLKRNYGMGDTNCQFEMKPLKHQKSEFTLNVGKRQAMVVCKNKREGKQRAAQAMLQLLHPHINSLGSLLRLYGRSSSIGMKEKKKEEHSITELQAHACSNKPNTAVLQKLKIEMAKLQEQKEAIKSKGKIRVDSASLPGQITGLDL